MSKVGHILAEYIDFRVHLWIFGAENTLKSRPFKTKNNAWTLLKQLQNNFEKVEKSTFLTTKIVKNVKTVKVGKILNENLNFRGLL